MSPFLHGEILDRNTCEQFASQLIPRRENGDIWFWYVYEVNDEIRNCDNIPKGDEFTGYWLVLLLIAWGNKS